jgi:hypothetical protein
MIVGARELGLGLGFNEFGRMPMICSVDPFWGALSGR